MIDTAHNSHAKELLNIQYSVFFGVVFCLSFYVDPAGGATIRPVLSSGRAEAFLLIVYFLLDWFTANVIEQRRFPTPGHLFLRLAWVAVLGATVVSMMGDGLWKFYLLSIYVVVAGAYDFAFLWRNLDHSGEGGANSEVVCGVLLASSRFLVGLAFLIPMLMGTIGRSDVLAAWDNPNALQDYVFGLMLLYVVLKAGRFLYLARLPDAALAQGVQA